MYITQMFNFTSSNVLNKIFGILCFAAIIIFFVFNILTPLIADDYKTDSDDWNVMWFK